MIENEKVEELMLELEDKTEKTISVLEGEYTAIRAGVRILTFWTEWKWRLTAA